MLKSALIPAKSYSQRVANKNFRPFFQDLSLVDLKILALQAAGITNIVLSSDDGRAEGLAKNRGVKFQRRPRALCGSEVNLAELFTFCLRDMEDDLVFWAHPTSPFVSSGSIRSAFDMATQGKHLCTIGVQKMQEFLWLSDRPLNYDEKHQPRSQDLEPYFRVTGGIHIARGYDFCQSGAVSFRPHAFMELSAIESIDINANEDWDLAQRLSVSVFRDMLL
jgi:CMP-N-acetylneuraminic acid synthetase